MAIKRTVAILAIFILAAIVSGCAIGNKGELYYNRTTTIGQEMIDLKTALDNGAVTQEEYDKLKADLMKNEKFKFECKAEKDKYSQNVEISSK